MADILPLRVVRTSSHQITAILHLNETDIERNVVITGTREGLLLVWNLKTQLVEQTEQADDGKTTVLTLLQTNKGVVSHTRSATVRIWHWQADGSLIIAKEVRQHAASHTFCCCGYAELCGQNLLAIPHEEKITLYRDPYDDITISCESMCMSLTTYTDKDDTRLLLGLESGHISLYAVDNRLSIKQLSSTSIGEDPVMTLDYNSVSNYGVCAGPKEAISVWRLNDENCLTKHLTINSSSEGYNCVKIRGDCKLFIACAWDGLVRLYSVKRGILLARLDFHRDSVLTVAFDDRLKFTTASNDNTICTWDIYSH